MTEKTKTLVFLVLALVLFGFASLSRPQIRPVRVEEMIGKPLFPKFTDPLAIKKLDILRRGVTGEADEFRIVELNGSWKIPSHDNYPADAKDQMSRIADALIDLKVLDVADKLTDSDGGDAGNVAAIHSTYGVVDPSADNAATSEGVGVKVTLSGVNQSTKIEEMLVELIIGKPVEHTGKTDDELGDSSGQRYVRVAGQSPVYIVKIDIERFSTKFDQWIEKNLLDIRVFDIAEVFVDDYSLELQMTADQGLGIILNNICDITVAHDSNEGGEKKWSLKNWMGYRGAQREYYAKNMGDNEELNSESLEDMLKAINELKIVNVSKKPEKLAEALRNNESFDKIKADKSLFNAGFYLAPVPAKGGKAGGVKLLASQGDIQIRMKDGICYNLRFGELTGTQTATNSNKNSEKKDENDKKKDDDDNIEMLANRYLFINADFDESLIPPADIQQLPEIPTSGDQSVIDTIKKEREAKEKSNLREQERVAGAIEDGKKRVKKLSARFADWYYVIAEDVYKKIRLTEASVIRTKPTPQPDNQQPIPPQPNSPQPTRKKPTINQLPNLPGTEGEFKIPIE
jgi:uncharacterized membrane protein